FIMILLQLLIALFLPWLLGLVWLHTIWRKLEKGAWPLILGYGYLLGMLTTTLLMRLWDRLGFNQAFWPLVGLLFILLLLGLWVDRKTAWRGARRAISEDTDKLNLWKKLCLGLLIIVLMIRFADLGLEILCRPLYPWDAWTTWASRAHVWFALKDLVPFVDSADWLHSASKEIYTIPAWYYPKTISLIPLWISLALERWDDSLINLPWLLCAITLGLAFYGQLRCWGLTLLTSLLGTYLLLSLP